LERLIALHDASTMRRSSLNPFQAPPVYCRRGLIEGLREIATAYILLYSTSDHGLWRLETFAAQAFDVTPD